MMLKGKLAELMVKVAPQIYRKYVTTGRKGEAVLYVKPRKALYGLLRSALLFYRKLVGELIGYGFEVNPYDPWVANMTIKGTQMTVTWHVDDLKVSHAEGAEIDRLAECARAAANAGLEVHAGHGLTFDTVHAVAAMPEFVELNIGHFLIGEAMFLGLHPAIAQMRNLMDEARQ